MDKQKVLLNVAQCALGRFASNFRHGDDQLSKIASKRVFIQRGWGEAMDRDATFDGGEFSGPACARALEQELDAVTPEWFDALVASRITPKSKYFLGL